MKIDFVRQFSLETTVHHGNFNRNSPTKNKNYDSLYSFFGEKLNNANYG